MAPRPPAAPGRWRRVAAAGLLAALGWACGEPATGPVQAAEPQAAPAPPADPAAFDAARAWAHLEAQVAIGPRPAGSAAAARTRDYIRAALAEAGIEAREQAFDAVTPVGPLRMVNLVATLPGRRPERIALATHYDTKRFAEFRFVGASDGASSTAVVLELARALQQRDREYTIELIFFDGEEATLRDWTGTDHTYGSRHYVEAARADGTLDTLEALILLDMVGDRNLNIRREASSTPWLTDLVWAAAARLGYGGEFLPQRTTVEDDHWAFLEAGIPAIDIIDLDYPAWHTAADDLDQVSARSLEVTGRTVLAALPDVEAALAAR